MEFKQTSFNGGLNLLLDDTRLPVSFKYKEGDSPYDITFNQYRMASNARTRFDVCTPVKKSLVDNFAPPGLKQGLVTFGNYEILFVAGSAYYKLNTEIGWTQIVSFSMDRIVPRYWTVAIPLATTNYGRLAVPNSSSQVTVNGTVAQVSQINTVAGTFANVPGLLVQDGKNQPQFIYIDNNGIVQCRVTQNYSQWAFPINTTTLALTGPDAREYVPIGTFMAWYNGILFIVDPSFNYIYRSVSGRPLDFVVNVDNNGNKGGDATTTSYSVGVNGITALRTMPGNMLFVAAGNSACFSISLNQTPNAPTIFGEYTFNRTFLFNANCVTDLGIVDIAGSPGSPNSGDSVFIDANGLRSFNAIETLQNEGRNSVFSSTVQNLFSGIVQASNLCSAINFDSYVIFSVNTSLGYCLVVYDTINNCYSALDFDQVGNAAVKQFAAINIDTLSLYAITSDDRVIQLFASSDPANALIRLGSVSAQDPKKELKVVNIRTIFSNITTDFSVTCSLFTNNRLDETLITNISYQPPVNNYSGAPIGNDVGTQTNPIMFSFVNANQGWKAFPVITWTGGASLVAVSISTQDSLPMQSPSTQAVVIQ